MMAIQIGGKSVGEKLPVFIVAEIGINHNGDVQVARKLIDSAVLAGCDAVKFQKRTPSLCVPEAQREVVVETPWGLITYMEYREKVELGEGAYREIDAYCRQKGIIWFASCWDVPSVDFIRKFDPPCYKVSSASLTDHELIDRMVLADKPVILSTGMSTMEEIESALSRTRPGKAMILHTTSTYPCSPDELNLKVIGQLQERFGVPVGYSGHEVGLQTTYAAVVLGACMVERHITLDRAMWGSDQAASVEPGGLMRLVRDIRVIERAMGDGVKRIYESEMKAKKKLRRQPQEPAR